MTVITKVNNDNDLSFVRFLELSTYFGINHGQFLMAVSFVMARILRSNKSDETWCKLKT